MSILTRYILRQAFGALMLILLSLTAVVWIALALKQMEVMTSQGQDVFMFFRMTSLALPALITFVAPIAMLIAVLHVLNRLGTDSELIVMTAGGQPAWNLLVPLMFLAAFVCAIVTFINHIAAPWANRALGEAINKVRTDLISQVLQPGRFSSPEPNVTIHIRDRTPDGELKGLLMHDARDPAQVSSYLAESGRIIRQGNATYMLMSEGHILRRTGKEQPAEIIVFDRYALDIQRFEQRDVAGLVTRPREHYTPALMFPSPNDPLWKSQPSRYISELHDRLSASLYPFAFALIAIAAAGQARTTRQPRNGDLVAGFGAAFGLRFLGIAGANATVGNADMWWMMYAFPLSGMAIALALIAWNMRPRPPSRLSVGLEAFNRAALARAKALWPRRAGVPRGATA